MLRRLKLFNLMGYLCFLIGGAALTALYAVHKYIINMSTPEVPGGEAFIQDTAAVAVLTVLMVTVFWMIYQRQLNARKKLEFIINKSPVIFFLWRNVKGWPVDFVTKNIHILGYDREEFLVKKMPYANIIHADDLQRVEEEVEKSCKESNACSSHEYRIITKDGKTRWVDERLWVCRDKNGEVIHFQGTVMDITERKATDEALRQEKDYAENIIETASIMVVGLDQEGNVRLFNETAEKITGYAREEIIGKNWFETVFSHDKYLAAWEEFKKYVADSQLLKKQYENYIVTKSGEERFISWRNSRVKKSSGDISIISFGIDLTDRIKMEEKIKFLSIHDILTGLYNRTYFEEEMKRLNNGRFDPVGVIVCDVDGLKKVNDSQGHKAGDDLLVTAAKVIKSCFRDGDVICRIGGDEFVIFLTETPPDTVKMAYERLKKRVNDYNLKQQEIELGISAGYAVKESGADIEVAFKEADDMMYNDKRKKCQMFQ